MAPWQYAIQPQGLILPPSCALHPRAVKLITLGYIAMDSHGLHSHGLTYTYTIDVSRIKEKYLYNGSSGSYIYVLCIIMQSGKTVLMTAASNGHTDIVKYLVKEITIQINATDSVSQRINRRVTYNNFSQ